LKTLKASAEKISLRLVLEVELPLHPQGSGTSATRCGRLAGEGTPGALNGRSAAVIRSPLASEPTPDVDGPAGEEAEAAGDVEAAGRLNTTKPLNWCRRSRRAGPIFGVEVVGVLRARAAGVALVVVVESDLLST
jgi:hypothetical protein